MALSALIHLCIIYRMQYLIHPSDFFKPVMNITATLQQ